MPAGRVEFVWVGEDADVVVDMQGSHADGCPRRDYNILVLEWPGGKDALEAVMRWRRCELP